MNPLQQTDDLRFEEHPIISQLQESSGLIFQQGLLGDRDEDFPMPEPEINITLTDPKKSKKRPRNKGSLDNEVTEDYENERQQKIRRRDFERQRRQEMKKLCASLRSLLPLEYIKGRRAVSDHMHEAVNYIKDLQRNIKELSLTRDKLKKLPSNNLDQMSSKICSGTGDQEGNIIISSNANHLPNFVTVNPCRDGAEILINSSSRGAGVFPLSKVLVELALRRLNAVTCVSTQTNDQRFLHRIHFEAVPGDLTRIDLWALRERLMNVINLRS